MLKNTLIISDLHIPFEHPGALKHCKKVYRDYNCNQVVFIGDLIDNHYSSFHTTDPDGYGAGEELLRAKDHLRGWYRAFPKAFVTVGSHDLRVLRQAEKNGVSKEWIRGLNEVLCVPKWQFVTDITINGVKYLHGDGCASTLQSILQNGMSMVFGHWHSKFEIVYNNGKFGMCVGCLIDQEAYAFNYAKTWNKKSILGCGVVLNNGKMPILIPMNI